MDHGRYGAFFHTGDTSAVQVVGEKKDLLTVVYLTRDGYITRYFGQGSSLDDITVLCVDIEEI